MSDRSIIRDDIRAAPFLGEAEVAGGCLERIPFNLTDRQAASEKAADLIERIRADKAPHLMESLLAEFGLSTLELDVNERDHWIRSGLKALDLPTASPQLDLFNSLSRNVQDG